MWTGNTILANVEGKPNGQGGGALLARVWMADILVLILQLERHISSFLIADEIPDRNN